MSVRLGLGDCVLVRTDEFKQNETNSMMGLIKYIGYIHGQQYASRQYIGVELLEPIPNGHDGIINGYQYFTAPKGHGIHLQITNIIKKLNVDEILMKLKDILSFFKTKLSQYITALCERDEYIEKLKQKQKHLKLLLNNSHITLQDTVSHLALQNTVSHELVKKNNIKNKNKNVNANNNNVSSENQKQLPIINDTYTSDSISYAAHNNNINNHLAHNMHQFLADHDNETINSSLRMNPITPMTPATTIPNMMNMDSDKTTSSITIPNMKNNKTDNNSNSTSYASTNTNNTTSANTSTYTTTHTGNTMGSTRAVLEVIPDEDEDENKHEYNKSIENNKNKKVNKPTPQIPQQIVAKNMHYIQQHQLQHQQLKQKSPKLMINTNYNVYNMQHQQGYRRPISPPLYYAQFSPTVNHKYHTIQSPLQYQIIPNNHVHFQQMVRRHSSQNKVIMPTYNKQYVCYQPQPQSQSQQMIGDTYIKQNNKKYMEKQHYKMSNGSNRIPRHESVSTEWTESTYNNSDMDALQNAGFVISNQYAYDGSGL